MDLHALPFTAADELAGLLALALALVAWKRRQQPGARAFALGAFCTFWWCSLHGVSLLAANLQAKYIMIQFWYPGPAIAAWAYLTFAIQYSWPSLRLSKRLLALLAASPTLTLLALWTNPLHHLFWTTLYLDRNGPFPMFGIVHGPLFGASLVLADIAIGLNCALLLRLAFKHKGLYRDQAALVILGGAVACGSELMYVTGQTPLPSLDFTPLILSVSAALFGWALFGPRLLDMIPVAHELIMDAVADAVIVLDAQERVVYLNRAARNLEGATIGRPLDSSLSEITRLLTETPPQAEGRSELRRGVSRQLTVFDVRVAPVLDSAGAIRGRSVVLR
ncbi:MAG: PAS domain-containing protein, partial [Chloroflexi bacterium]|nr:PAS domain-containing protein [Chloroflexota bacterium]